MKKQHWMCPHCGSSPDHGVSCKCQQIDLQPQEITKTELDRLARPLLEIVPKFFEDPIVAADFERWLVEYRKRPKKKAAV